MIRINPDRLLASLHRLADFGRYKTGVHRPTYSPQDVEARNWFADELRKADLTATIDGVGNVLGACKSSGPVLLIGSHIETECHGGWLDGALGVIYGLEIARAFAEDSRMRGLGIDVGAWADEECHYIDFLGSRSFTGDLVENEMDLAVNKDDRTPLREALRQAGYDGRPRLRMDPARYAGYLEAHIEQGDYLDTSGISIGVVTSIVGLFQYRITFSGEQNHAGTTRMATRKDAGAALVKFAAEIDGAFKKVTAARSVWTTGQIVLRPGAPCIIPGYAHMDFQFRDADPEQLTLFENTLQELVELSDGRPCEVRMDTVYRAMPKIMAPDFQGAVERAAEIHAPDNFTRMPSAAVHDAQIFAKYLPSGMLFVPSIGGISHDIQENTSEDDIVLGCQVLASAAEDILRARSPA